jgi:adenine-specific DNA methylase
MTETWDKLPLNLMDELAEKETYRRDVYRPIYSLHKWWARRPGSTFRCLGLAAMTDDTITKNDILTERTTGSHDGLYLDSYNEAINPNDKHIDRDLTILDPFAGGGTTLVEANRLDANVVGYELNPVAWWTQKKSMDDVNLDVLRREFDRILEELRDELSEYYTTIDPETGKECEVLYYFQSQVISVPNSDATVQLFPRYQLTKTKKTSSGVIYCPNEDCDDRIFELENREAGLEEGTVVTINDGKQMAISEDENEICPVCGTEFDPSDGNYGYGKYVHNGNKYDVKETLQRRGEKPTFERFALQYVDPDGNKRIKEFDADDANRVEKAQQKLEKIQQSLPIPDQNIPVGDETDRIVNNYNYEKFNDLFTDRQLLTIGLLFNRAKEVGEMKFEEAEAQNISEFIITAVSDCLRFHNKLAKWQASQNKANHLFTRHAFIPRVQPVEANPLNSVGNLTSFNNFADKSLDAKEYCELPFEKIKNRKKGKMEQFYVNSESISDEEVEALNCKTAEKMDLENESVDLVITDPPYYDNVQYSELSDYFYVWLRECLKDQYDEFQPELVPKAREIVANSSANKDEEFFVESLSNVFSECYRVLKQDGEMVFTYHHNENEAWSVILEALIQSGFTITGAYPVQSEMPNNPHISELDNAEYDILIYANKEQVDEEITLTELRQNLFFELQEMADEERQRHEDLSKADLGVILRGKCMYYYSRHYPDIYSEGEQAGIDEALDTVDSIIEQVLEGSVNLPDSVDPLTEAYAAFVQRGAEEYDDLNKQLLAKNLNVSDMEDEKLVRGPRDKKEPVTADERIAYIESKLNNNGTDPAQSELTEGEKENEALLDIDKVHYLYHLYKTDQNTIEYLKEWKTDDLEDLAGFMADVTGDERYENVMDMGITQF